MEVAILGRGFVFFSPEASAPIPAGDSVVAVVFLYGGGGFKSVTMSAPFNKPAL